MQTHTLKAGAILLATTLSLNASVALAQSSMSDLENVAASPNNAPVTTSSTTTTTTSTSADTTPAAETTHAAAQTFLADVAGVKAEPTAGGVKLAWPAVVGADHYTVYFGTKSAATTATGEYEKEEYVTSGATTFEVKNLAADTMYYLAVTAENTTTKKTSQYYSDEITATPLAAAATVEATTPTSTTPAATTTKVDDSNLTSADVTKASAPAELPKSGPFAGVAMVIAAAGSYVIRRFKKA